jgi:hypothetical protein
VTESQASSQDPLMEAVRLYERYVELSKLAEVAALREGEEAPTGSTPKEQSLGLEIRTSG